MLQLSINSIDQLTIVCKALSTPLRIKILQLISNQNLSIVELAQSLDTSLSTVASNIKILEDAGLILTELHSASRGTKRVCSKNYADIFINLDSRHPYFSENKIYEINMPVGHYIDCNVGPTCGLIGNSGIISSEDFPSSFFDPARVDAKNIWFRKGYVIYRFPNHIANPSNINIISLDFSLEICSEAPNYEMDWPSDITFWINNKEITTWTSPSDFGDRKGKLKSYLWEKKSFSQYGVLQCIHIDNTGTCLNMEKVSPLKIDDLQLLETPVIDLKVGIKDDAEYKGGINIFGSGFGDYDQDIKMTINYQFHQ